ncbi:glycosyltransferase 61 family protein [Sulfuriflexus mobilis]|uniref:glycosyltransferase 61 family protein n=1 Tax=Sulfuriflexus mobilis TaxID=1811807 RepID=UPI000F81B0C9|nr:glycosyltransferase 61 family protein [Sulfuriflexus mobilis]
MANSTLSPEELVQSGRYGDALRLLSDLAKKNPSNINLSLDAARLLRQMGNHGLAIEVLNEVRGVPSVHLSLTKAYLSQCDYRNAFLNYEFYHHSSSFNNSSSWNCASELQKSTIILDILNQLTFGTPESAISILLGFIHNYPFEGWWSYIWMSHCLRAKNDFQGYQDCSVGKMERALGKDYFPLNDDRTAYIQEIANKNLATIRCVHSNSNIAPVSLNASTPLGGFTPNHLKRTIPSTHDDINLISLKNGRACLHQCGVAFFDENDRFLPDISNGDSSIIGTSDLLPISKKIKGNVLFLANAYACEFFHWVAETLPRILCMKSSTASIDSIDYVFLRHANNLHISTLSLLGIDKSKIITSEDSGIHISADNLFLVDGIDPEYPSYETNPFTINLMRDAFLHFAEETSNNRDLKHIYIKRRGFYGREIINISELESMLDEGGFTGVSPEKMTFPEQIYLFNNCTALIAPAGGALSNLVFASKDLNLCVTYPQSATWKYYWSISNHIGFRHYHIIGKEPDCNWTVDPDWMDIENNRSYFVNLDAIKEFLKRISL